MADILIYKGKHGDVIYDISTQEKEEAAYLLLFNILNEDGCYNDLNKEEKLLYNKAKKNDAHAAKILIKIRSNAGYEYEEIELDETIDATK